MSTNETPNKHVKFQVITTLLSICLLFLSLGARIIIWNNKKRKENERKGNAWRTKFREWREWTKKYRAIWSRREGRHRCGRGSDCYSQLQPKQTTRLTDLWATHHCTMLPAIQLARTQSCIFDFETRINTNNNII